MAEIWLLRRTRLGKSIILKNSLAGSRSENLGKTCHIANQVVLGTQRLFNNKVLSKTVSALMHPNL